jgi:hypothetical protein
MVAYFFTGIFLSAFSGFIIVIPDILAFFKKALCTHFLTMSSDRLEKHTRFFRIQPDKT